MPSLRVRLGKTGHFSGYCRVGKSPEAAPGRLENGDFGCGLGLDAGGTAKVTGMARGKMAEGGGGLAGICGFPPIRKERE